MLMWTIYFYSKEVYKRDDRFKGQKDFVHLFFNEDLLGKCLKSTTLFAFVKVDLLHEHVV